MKMVDEMELEDSKEEIELERENRKSSQGSTLIVSTTAERGALIVHS